ncbi:hypothetical protein J2810_002539 [Chryseobacterium rhizosphaerae]|uniref:hypothetical protein n=1 Tax=Chryseobacterium rhizosphaerae TaxID=395937 RepID=UPI00285E77C4|nr:hypothetical protein [Chryseobacterium rhizosphaerae]MDR6546480.1 hypothetical protein [Chryseobacterium rhizosphaerae]
MKTIISTILIIAGSALLHSCRESEIEEPLELEKLNVVNSKTEMSKYNDTIQTGAFSTDPDPELDESIKDPPIRHGGQWKTSK